jgi:antitoxin ParD1/3/4
MAAKHHRHIALTEPHARFVEEEVDKGRYASASEVVRAGLRLLIEREDAGARPLDEARQSHG